MFEKIKEFFMGSKPTPVERPQEVVLTPVDVAIKNIKETTAAVDAKVEVAPAKEKPWTEKPPAPIAKKATPRPQSVKATPAPKKKKPPAKN